jgi:hypothetical protein
MKRNLLFIVCVLLLSAVFISCQKDIVIDDLPGAASVKLKTYIEDARNTPYNAIDTFNVAYDATDRILALISNSTGAKFLFEYYTGSYALEIKNYDHVIIRDVSYINSAGLVDSTVQVNDTDDSSTSKLIYNASKQVIEERTYTYSALGGPVLEGINYYTYDNNGNAITYTEKDESGQTISVTSYTYNDVLNTVFLTPSYHPLPFKNLPVTRSTVYTGGTTESSTSEYTYEISNRVTREKETYSDGTFVIKRYEYY